MAPNSTRECSPLRQRWQLIRNLSRSAKKVHAAIGYEVKFGLDEILDAVIGDVQKPMDRKEL